MKTTEETPRRSAVTPRVQKLADACVAEIELSKKRPYLGNVSTVTPRALKLPDACRYLGNLSISTVRRAVKKGLLTPCQPQRTWLFRIEDLDRNLELGKTRFNDMFGKPSARSAKYYAEASE